MRQIEGALAQSLEDIEHGRRSLDECLEEHPELRNELEPLLRVARRVPPAPQLEPSSEFRLRARTRLQAEIARTRPTRRWPAPWAMGLRPRLTGALAAVVLAFLFLVGGGAGVTLAAQEAIPGDTLYPVKQGTEDFRLLLIRDAGGRAEYHITLAQRRLQETIALAREGRSIDVSALESIAAQLDAALEEVRGLSRAEAHGLLTAFAGDLALQQTVLTDAARQASPSAQQALGQAGVVIKRGEIVTRTLADDPTRLSLPVSINGANQGEVRGLVTSLEPLRIAGILVTSTPSIQVIGRVQLGYVAEAEGVLLPNGTLRASKIEGKEDQDTEAELVGVITRTDPLTVLGSVITLDRHTQIDGVLWTGLIASVEGELQADGSLLAKKLDIERLEGETEIRGMINALEPLTVGTALVVLAHGAEVEGILRIGAGAEVEGTFLADGRFLASEIVVEEYDQNGETREIEGFIVEIVGDTVVVRMELGERVPVRVTPNTQIKLADGRFGALSDLHVGGSVEVELDALAGEALEIEVQD